MSETKSKAEAAPKQAEATEFEQSLDEFCVQLSAVDRRVEMIGAFHSTERQAGRIKALPSQFSARFEAFVNAPA